MLIRRVPRARAVITVIKSAARARAHARSALADGTNHPFKLSFICPSSIHPFSPRFSSPPPALRCRFASIFRSDTPPPPTVSSRSALPPPLSLLGGYLGLIHLPLNWPISWRNLVEGWGGWLGPGGGPPGGGPPGGGPPVLCDLSAPEGFRFEAVFRR